jgi:hypothetical protein
MQFILTLQTDAVCFCFNFSHCEILSIFNLPIVPSDTPTKAIMFSLYMCVGMCVCVCVLVCVYRIIFEFICTFIF